jgi:hypothetical protein
MRGVRCAPVRMERYRHLGDVRSPEARLDDHLGRELHPGATLIELLVMLLREPTHAAVDIVDRRPEPRPCERREHRVAPAAVEERHRSGHNAPAAAFQSATLHKGMALAQLAHELRELEEVVAVVGIAHHDVSAFGGGNAPHQGASVTPLLHLHEPCTLRGRDVFRSVSAAVVGNDYLTPDPVILHRLLRLAYASRQGVRLVEAR